MIHHDVIFDIEVWFELVPRFFVGAYKPTHLVIQSVDRETTILLELYE